MSKITVHFEELKRDSLLPFGKYKGKRLSHVLAHDTPYLLWMRINTDVTFTKGINREIDRRMLMIYTNLKNESIALDFDGLFYTDGVKEYHDVADDSESTSDWVLKRNLFL